MLDRAFTQLEIRKVHKGIRSVKSLSLPRTPARVSPEPQCWVALQRGFTSIRGGRPRRSCRGDFGKGWEEQRLSPGPCRPSQAPIRSPGPNSPSVREAPCRCEDWRAAGAGALTPALSKSLSYFSGPQCSHL